MSMLMCQWKKRVIVLQYWAYRDEIFYRALSQGYRPSFELIMEFIIPMPKSWSKKKKAKMVGKPHQQTPDLDNLIKSLDAIVPDDCGIWDKSAKKFWAETGRIRLENIRNE